MSNAPEGRTYMKMQWVLDPDIVSGKKPSSNSSYYTGADYIIAETPYVVPNGKWVLMRPLGSPWCKLVGVDHSEVEDIVLDDLYGIAHVLYVSNKPFGFVTAEDLEYIPGELQPIPIGGKYLHVAQKVHKGELLPGIEIPKIEIVREEPALKSGGRERNRDQKRNHIRWARLSDVVAAAGVSAEELLLGYWPFIGWSYDHTSMRHGTLLHIVLHDSPEEFKTRQTTFQYFDQEETRRIVSDSTENMWIRAGLAKTILRLQTLGVQPEVTQPV